MKRTFTFAFLLLNLQFFAQSNPEYVLGDVLVKIEHQSNIRLIINDLQYLNGTRTQIEVVEEVSKPMDIWLIHFDESAIDHDAMLNYIKSHPKIQIAQFNYKTELRTVPNDPQFGQQWQYINTGQTGGIIGADMDADSAWDITTGGLTALGDTIVICIIDGGIDLNHNDLTPNRWINWNEIPNNNIDDDNNGYVDDRLGWNTFANNDNISGSSHGTAVAGIIGAKGNNGIGVTGVNWDVKMMIIRGGTGVQSEVLQAYTYPLEARKRYNETNGSEGAFVVATNASWGVNQANPANFPLWCAMYDTLGKYGILNAGAGPNANFDVDVVGDMPTGCSSEYLITVTNMSHNDTKVTQAGYGATTIDLGAHGEGTFTTTNNGYSSFGGTSGATPHVTGTIGLLYSAPCPSLATLAKADPQLATEMVRDYIYNNLDSNASLTGITVYEGRLNAHKALKDLMENCPDSDCIPPFSVNVTNVMDTSITVNWNAIQDTTRTFITKYRVLGDTIWNTISDTSKSALITGLSACIEYEIQIGLQCDSSIAESQIYIFKTEGCCELPDGLTISSTSDTSAMISWNSIFAATNYVIQYRKAGTTSWNSDTTSNTSMDYPQLEFCTTYEYQLQVQCDTGFTSFTPIEEFYTECGNCTNLNYCNADGSTQFEWIQSVSINGNIYNTGNNNGKYMHRGIAAVLDKDGYSLSITPGYNGNPFNENANVYIDYNQDGDFTDAGELVAQLNGFSTTATANFSVPITATVGVTRMRFILEYNGNPASCANGIEGEVEDYCIEITDFVPCDAPTNIDSTQVTETSMTINWNGGIVDSTYLIRYRIQNATTWTYTTSNVDTVGLANLVTCTPYEVEIATICTSGDTSNYTSTAIFMTECVDNVNNTSPIEWDAKVFPNPFSNHLTVQLDLKKQQDLKIQIFNLNGELIQEQQFGKRVGEQQLQVFTAALHATGIYILKMIGEDETVVFRVLKE